MPVVDLTTERLGRMNQASTAVRRERAAVKQQLRTGTLALADALLDPPDALLEMPVIDVIRAIRSDPRRTAALWQINAWAVRDNVNLMMPVGRASVRTRQWAAENGGLWSRFPARAA